MAEKSVVLKKPNDDDYLKPVKFVRDLVLGYVYLTKFDIKIIDTLEFQRLKDIRQLTCQQVFPSALHTRFEHSLGVMELTRQALDNLNINGFIFNDSDDMPSDKNNDKNKIFNKHLRFNAALAALLHDVGHCPFSHLGEAEMNADDVWIKLRESVVNCEELKNSTLCVKFKEQEKTPSKGFGAKHEQLSCIVILDKTLKELLSSVGVSNKTFDDESPQKVDFELLIRSILGMEYDVSTSDSFKNNKEKNVIVNLINSWIFDLDKLDYVMRDSWFTGIGAPKIDIHRLFRNMYLNNKNTYGLVFTNRAVPALQNLIESRDELYMYVYNHHTSVFSDFMFSYIFRRLAHNERDFIRSMNSSNEKSTSGEKELRSLDVDNRIFNMGIVPYSYLFSPEAIIEHKRSDSSFISLLNDIEDNLSSQKEGNILNNVMSFTGDKKASTENIYELVKKIQRTHTLIDKYQKRTYLKPWWKTSSEFNNFIKTNFLDDPIREKLCKWICHGDGDLESDEFCSQLAKNVSNITRKLITENVNCGLIEELNNDEFFVIQRSSHFFDPETIGKLEIALKSNEMLGSPKDVKYCSGNYYIKSLTKVIPQRDYYSMYAENSFYIFSKQLNENDDMAEGDDNRRNRHYHFIEQIFVFVATTLINDGIRKFVENYDGKVPGAEEAAHQQMYENFKKSQGM